VDLEFTSDQEELRDSVRSFLQKECPIDLVRAMVEKGETSDALWSAMVGLDWPALAIPEEDGGIGLSFVEMAVVAEELGRVIAPGPLLATATQFAPVVRELGSAEQRKRFLGGVASGELTGALALADHPRRWRLDELTTTATHTGDGWILSGTKHGVLADITVDELAVVVRADDGFAAFVVPGADAQLAPVHAFDASRPLCSATFDDLHIPADRVLGKPGSAQIAHGVTRAIDEATVALALETLGTCDTIFTMVLAYVKDRQQFGKPIGSFQAIKHKMTDMFVSLERARSLCYYAVAAIEGDDPIRRSAVAMAKAASDDCQRLVCQDSFQSFGGIGFTWEHDLQLFIKRAKTSGALLGGSSTYTLETARLILADA
jgi:alkylation response protein AidB-like acyl-CoA dehydrogenase